jgi:gamma-glutamylcysteine synthetase
MNATQYREKLEGEKAKIERMQESAEGRKSLILRNRLKSIVGDLMELNAGTHWTQQQGDTLHRIVIGDLSSNGSKRLNQ